MYIWIFEESMLKDSRLAITEHNSSDINKIDSFRDQFLCCLTMTINFGEASSSCAISYSSTGCRDTQNIAVSPAVKVCWMTWNTKTTKAWPHCNKKIIVGLLFLPVININCYIFSNITQHFSEINSGFASKQVSASCFIIPMLWHNICPAPVSAIALMVLVVPNILSTRIKTWFTFRVTPHLSLNCITVHQFITLERHFSTSTQVPHLFLISKVIVNLYFSNILSFRKVAQKSQWNYITIIHHCQ